MRSPHSPLPRQAFAFVSILTVVSALPLGAAPERVSQDAAGRTRFAAPAVPEPFRTPWPAAQEEAFWDRLQPVIAAFKGKANPRSQGEGEK